MGFQNTMEKSPPKTNCTFTKKQLRCDLAMKYGYESPASFTEAFSGVHGEQTLGRKK